MAKTWGEKLEESIGILTLGAGLLALFLGIDNWWVIFVVGWVVLTPLADILFDGDEETDRTTDGEASDDETTEDALETLRDRYARGELTEAQFERTVEGLLETETLEDARDRLAGSADTVAQDGSERQREREQKRDSERERAPEPELDPES